METATGTVQTDANTDVTLTTSLNQYIDHTQLTFKPGEDAVASIHNRCNEAMEQQFYAVCIPLLMVPQAKQLLDDSSVKVATVIGFPTEKTSLDVQKETITIGRVPNSDKLKEVKQAVAFNADELDIVLDVHQFKVDYLMVKNSLNWENTDTFKNLATLQQAANGCPIKLIVETDLLTEAEIIAATHLCHQLDLFMIKTSTGMISDGNGAVASIVKLIRKTITELDSPLQIKASGGIRDKAKAEALIAVGANRLGTSASLTIVN